MEEQIKEALKKGPKSNRELRVDLGLKTKSFDAKLDRMLQRMRKEGKIKAVKGRWYDSTFVTCPGCGGKGWVKK